jgi:hypothetical protein
MTDILGFIGFLVIVLIVLPASLLAFIRVFQQPVKEIINLWITLIDTVIDIIESVKKQFTK